MIPAFFAFASDSDIDFQHDENRYKSYSFKELCALNVFFEYFVR
jgi:hypothetical protein